MLQGLVPNNGDGWQWFLKELTSWLAIAADRSAPASVLALEFGGSPKASAQDRYGAKATFDAASLLGQCTAEMHLALASSADVQAFVPEPMSADDLVRDAERIESQIKSTFEALKIKLASLDDASTDIAALLLSRRPELLDRARSIAKLVPSGQRIRIHGDYHLGQTLRTVAENSPTAAGDFVLIDFEGEPARPIEERRKKQSPLRDVAGMLRSFSYVAWSALDPAVRSAQENADVDRLSAWAEWWQNTASARFLQAYENTAAKNPILLPEPELAEALLKIYLLEKALYEVLYELNNRPAWLRIPMKGILTL
jgi:maltose alpha-D-glucosyltransferase/alpha-amylase